MADPSSTTSTVKVQVESKEDIAQGRADLSVNREELAKFATNIQTAINGLTSVMRSLSRQFSTAEAEDDGKKRDLSQGKPKAVMGLAADTTQAVVQNGVKILTGIFGIVKDVFQRLVTASPLLQSIQSLFSLAVQLFFMPLGTKLATEMLPAIMTLVENVMKIWDGFEDKSLGQILDETISMGVRTFSKYFKDFGESILSSLDGSGSVLGSIAGALISLGSFIEDHGKGLVDLVSKVVSYTSKNFAALLGWLVGFAVMHKALALAQIAATLTAGTAASLPVVGSLLAVGGGAAVVSGLVAQNQFAEGGYVPAKEGGESIIVAEGGEGEYIVPESKVGAFVAANSISQESASKTGESQVNLTLYINGYTDTDLEDKIVRTINERVNLSRLRSGF